VLVVSVSLVSFGIQSDPALATPGLNRPITPRIGKLQAPKPLLNQRKYWPYSLRCDAENCMLLLSMEVDGVLHIGFLKEECEAARIHGMIKSRDSLVSMLQLGALLSGLVQLINLFKDGDRMLKRFRQWLLRFVF
jgi:hypothetical protein